MNSTLQEQTFFNSLDSLHTKITMFFALSDSTSILNNHAADSARMFSTVFHYTTATCSYVNLYIRKTKPNTNVYYLIQSLQFYTLKTPHKTSVMKIHSFDKLSY